MIDSHCDTACHRAVTCSLPHGPCVEGFTPSRMHHSHFEQVQAAFKLVTVSMAKPAFWSDCHSVEEVRKKL